MNPHVLFLLKPTCPARTYSLAIARPFILQKLWQKMEDDKKAIMGLIDQRTTEIIAVIAKLTKTPYTELNDLINANTQQLSNEVSAEMYASTYRP